MNIPGLDHPRPVVRLAVVVVLLSVVVIAWGAWAARRDAAQWDAFRTTHGCRIVDHAAGKTIYRHQDPKDVGPGFVNVPPQAGWLCDDGVTYWRDE